MSFPNIFLSSSFVFVIGACLGSFFKLVIDRYGTADSFIFKPSYCLQCKKDLLWWHNIPIVSFLILKGRCFFCKSKVDIECFYSEIFTALVALILFLLIVLVNYRYFHFFIIFFFFMILVFLSMFDLKHRIIPHEITYTSIILIILVQVFFNKSIINPFINLAFAFLLMDFIYFFASLWKKINPDNNLLFIPLIIWSIYFFFFQNMYFVLFSIFIYFIILKYDFIKTKIVLLGWFVLFFLIGIQLLKLLFFDVNLNAFSFFICGIGIIYFVCEIIFYFIDNLINWFFKNKIHIEDVSSIPSHSDSSLTTDNSITLGGGDITTFALVTVFYGYKDSILVLFIASFLAVISHFMYVTINHFFQFKSYKKSQFMPFVPFLFIACFIIIVLKNVWK